MSRALTYVLGPVKFGATVICGYPDGGVVYIGRITGVGAIIVIVESSSQIEAFKQSKFSERVSDLIVCNNPPPIPNPQI